MKEELKKIERKHEQLRKILIDAGNEEFGDYIIDNICEVFNYPTTNVYYDKEGNKFVEEGEMINMNKYYIEQRTTILYNICSSYLNNQTEEGLSIFLNNIEKFKEQFNIKSD